jgi:hypothetical protein
MEEISLHIHTSGQESHEITVAPDIETEEFIRELMTGLNLGHADANGQRLIWEADDKDTGHTLAPGRTLHENGVRDGHHLYLNSRPAPQPPIQPPPEPKREIPRPPPPPVLPPNTPRWPLFMAVALIPVAAAGSYFWGAGQNQRLEAALRASQTEAVSAARRASAAEALASQAQQQVSDIERQQGGVSAQADQLKTQDDQLKQALNLKQSQLNAKDTQIHSQQNQITQLNGTVDQLRAAEAQDQNQLKQLQASSAQKAQALQNELAATRQTIASLEQKVQSLSTQKPPPQPVRLRYGSLVWTGDVPQGNLVEVRASNQTNVGRLIDGRLPGVPVAILVADPDRVSIEAEPDSATNWTRVVFRVNGRGRTTVRLFWIAM